MSQPFTPRVYQQRITSHALEHPRCNVWADMGLGKTVSTLNVIDALDLASSRFLPALVLAPKRVAASVWTREVEKWEHLSRLRVSVVIGTPAQRKAALRRPADLYTINYDNLIWLVDHLGADWPFATVIADECFPAGTGVSTPNGEAPIESVQVGDTVETHEGPRRVSHVFRKEVKSYNLVALNLSNGATIHATADHPFCTDAGWVRASDTAGRELYRVSDLPDLPDGIQEAKREGARTDPERAHSVLRPVMPHERDVQVPSGAERDVGVEHEALAIYHANAVELGAAVHRRATRGDVAAGEGCRTETDRAGRERPRAEPHGDVDRSAPPEGVRVEPHRIAQRRRTRLPLPLQARLRKPEIESLPGGGRQLSPNASRTGARRAEDEKVERVRVESVSHHQRGSVVPVYNLETEGAHTYFAEGFLVHNCSRLKGFRLRAGGKRARALSKIVKKTGRWINLTGTPAPNGLIDLWGPQWFVDGGERLGRTFTAFKERWFDENLYSREIKPKPHAQQEISELLSDVTVSLEAKDWLDLPPEVTNTVRVQLPLKARALYDRMEREMFLELDEHGIEAANAAVKTMKCLQISSGAIYTNEPWEAAEWEVVHDAKIEALREIVESQAGAPLLVAYHFKSDRARILAALNEAREILTEKDEDDWNAGRIPVGLVHPSSAGHGLNLQDGGSSIAFFTSWWNLEEHQQVIERIGAARQAQSGHNRPVMIHHIVAENTLDEAVLERLLTKGSVQDALRQRARVR